MKGCSMGRKGSSLLRPGGFIKRDSDVQKRFRAHCLEVSRCLYMRPLSLSFGHPIVFRLSDIHRSVTHTIPFFGITEYYPSAWVTERARRGFPNQNTRSTPRNQSRPGLGLHRLLHGECPFTMNPLPANIMARPTSWELTLT